MLGGDIPLHVLSYHDNPLNRLIILGLLFCMCILLLLVPKLQHTSKQEHTTNVVIQ